MENPSRDTLEHALKAAGNAHHDYESQFLEGQRDEQWAGWYAAYVLGRAGDFVTPTTLTKWLEEAPPSDDWFSTAASHIQQRLSSG